MEAAGLFAPNVCYVELGAGKGRLSQRIYDAVEGYPRTHFILVDRKNVRHKRDLHHQEVRASLSMERINIDIQDLVLSRVPSIRDNGSRPIVAYCKHLCGAATDLAFRCLFPRNGAGKGVAVNGLAMAVCCHHRCHWTSYVGRDYLLRRGFDRREFEAIIRMSSWAVCGTKTERREEGDGSPGDERKEEDEDKEHDGYDQVDGENKETLTSALGLTIPQREELGRLCKRLLDTGRIDFLRRRGMRARLVQYVDASVTLENVLIMATNEEES